MISRFVVTILIYCLIIMIGGVIGYVAAGSVVSLLMSAIFASLLISALFILYFSPTWGFNLISALLAILTIFFAYRWYISQKVIPAALMMLISLIVLLITLIWRYRKQ